VYVCPVISCVCVCVCVLCLHRTHVCSLDSLDDASSPTVDKSYATAIAVDTIINIIHAIGTRGGGGDCDYTRCLSCPSPILATESPHNATGNLMGQTRERTAEAQYTLTIDKPRAELLSGMVQCAWMPAAAAMALAFSASSERDNLRSLLAAYESLITSRWVGGAVRCTCEPGPPPPSWLPQRHTLRGLQDTVSLSAPPPPGAAWFRDPQGS